VKSRFLTGAEKQELTPKSTVTFSNYLIQKQETLFSLHPKVILIFLFSQWEQGVTQLGGGFGLLRRLWPLPGEYVIICA